jgi:hypothetical protein
MVNGSFNHRYNVSPNHLHALLGVWNFYDGPRVRRRLWSGPRLPEVWETLQSSGQGASEVDDPGSATATTVDSNK